MDRLEKTQLDELKLAALDCVIYFQYHNKNTTKKQDEKIERLKQALLKVDEKLY